MVGRVAIIGAGPAGLMAAEVLAERGIGVDIYEAMPSAARKFLMAGKSGLNISHSEPLERFLSRYRCTDPRLVEQVRAFGPDEIRTWMNGLGIEAFSGPSGRVFPKMMKASPLLRAWLKRLSGAGVQLHTRHRWQGWHEDGGLIFETPQGRVEARPQAVVFALGGASWSRLGADGAWAPLFAMEGCKLRPFGPSNCGFLREWSNHMQTRFAGAPVKSVAVSTKHEGRTYRARGEFVVTRRGVESGSIYALSAPLCKQLADGGPAHVWLDLLPDLDLAEATRRLTRPRAKQSLASFLRKTVRISGVKLALLHELAEREALSDPPRLAARLKRLDMPLAAPAPLDEAISTTGGLDWGEIGPDLSLTRRPGTFCTGEMLDWDAPTGGYLLTACLANGRATGKAVVDWLAR